MKVKQKIARCKDCGSEKVIVDKLGDFYQVICQECYNDVIGITRESAIDYWNKRQGE